MNAKFTQGEWSVEYDGSIVMNGQIVSGAIGIDGSTQEEKKANSMLIAAAPDLLEALQRIADGQEMSGTYTFGDVVLRYQEIARAAIAKAVSS